MTVHQLPNRLIASTSAFDSSSFPRVRRTVQEPKRRWRNAVVDRLNHLVALEKGWDGYTAGPVKFDTASFALLLLESSFDEDAPTPQIVPGAEGGLQIEWHLENGTIELDVEAPYRVHGWADIGGQETEETFTNDFTPAAEWLNALTEDRIATAATA